MRAEYAKKFPTKFLRMVWTIVLPKRRSARMNEVVVLPILFFAWALVNSD